MPCYSYLAPDGFIYDQRETSHLRYGLRSSAQNGCGWVAAYNLLHLLGRPDTPEAVRGSLAKSLPLGGLAGTHILALAAWLHYKGLPLRCQFLRRRARAAVRHSRGGIVWYFTGHGLHFCAFEAKGRGEFHFLNAEYGRKDLVLTLPAFRKKYCKAPFLWVMAVPDLHN